VALLILLDSQLFFIFLFNTVEFVSCHGNNAMRIVILLGIAIVIFGVLLPKGFYPATTSADLLEFRLLLF